MAERSSDLVVIGAGIVGAACAHELARAGARVRIVERGFPASGASGACEGNLLLWDKAPGAELELGKLSFRCWDALRDELEMDFEFDRKGSIMVCEREVDLAAAHSTVAWLGGEGVRCRVLDGRELRELEPNLADDLAGGAPLPDDVQVDARLATEPLGGAARGRGP